MFTPLPNDTILQNRYKIINLLGKGGMGAVYHVQHLRLKTEVAIKQIILADDADYLASFEHEASLLANLRHNYLPEVRDFFEEGNSYFIVMELINGEDLREKLKRLQKEGIRYLPFVEVYALTIQLLEVLDYLHRQNIIHKDIKPANLKSTSEGRLKLLDFGLAKGNAGLMSDTFFTFLKGGTSEYASPEQLKGESADQRSDLYSVAATMHHLLVGRVPPHSLTERAIQIADGELDPLQLVSEFNNEVPQEFAEILHRAMALNPNKRFQSSNNMLEALKLESVKESQEAEAQRTKEEEIKQEEEANRIRKIREEKENKKRQEEALRQGKLEKEKLKKAREKKKEKKEKKEKEPEEKNQKQALGPSFFDILSAIFAGKPKPEPQPVVSSGGGFLGCLVRIFLTVTLLAIGLWVFPSLNNYVKRVSTIDFANSISSLFKGNTNISASTNSNTNSNQIKTNSSNGVQENKPQKQDPTPSGTVEPLSKPPSPKIVSGGVVNSKATSLVKPQYPQAARAVRASGAVNVQVTISETGSVISASAVSGHPLLRGAAEAAARASKFSPTLLSGGQPVRVTGVLIYNFVPPD